MPATANLHDLRQFVLSRLLPAESLLAQGGEGARQCLAQLTEAAKATGLWGAYHPTGSARGLALATYLPHAEWEGYSEFGPALFGADVALDAHMLQRHASPVVRDRYLSALLRGDLVASYGMSEPDAIGSIPATLQACARYADGQWTISGRKWFICRAAQAGLVTVVARTEAAGVATGALSMIVVPTDAPGFRLERPLDILGGQLGQAEMTFDKVVVPADFVLGLPGQGRALMQERLALGRMLRSAHWLGLTQRCYDLLCARITSPRGELARLADKQLIRRHVYEVHAAQVAARALWQQAAQGLDAGQPDEVAINLAKLTASKALCLAADTAIQIYGAEGLSDALTPLAGIYRHARASRILDGTDEALINACGRRLLARQQARQAPQHEPASTIF